LIDKQTRLADELAWYDALRMNQRWYRVIKVLQLIAAALVPVMAGMGVSAWITGGLGSTIVVMEGIQQVYRFQEHWIAYRSTWEGCAASSTCYGARAGDYGTVPSPATLLLNASKRW
jgi:hypothetical protein